MNRTDGLTEIKVVIPTALADFIEHCAAKDQRGPDKVVALALEDYAQIRKLP